MNATYLQSYQTNRRPVTNPNLIRDLETGLEDAWGQLYAVYWDWLLGIAVRMGVGREDARDLVQKTFIALSNHISGFIYQPAKGRFSGYLLTVLQRNIFTFWKRNKRDPLRLLQSKPRSEEGTQTEPIKRIAGPPQNEVITQVAVNELREMIRESYEELKAQISAEQWAVFEAYSIQEIPVEEVATRFGLRQGSVYSIDSRGIRKLRRIMVRKLEAARKESEAFTARLNLQ